MEKREKEIRNLLSNSETFYQLKKELDNYYNTIDDKQDFLEWFEYSFLDEGIIIIKSDIEQYKGKHSALDYFGKSELQRYENCLKWINEKKANKITNQPLNIDLSDTKGTEKIIMLKKLGILDYLKEKQPFNTSKNALASALSGITGIDITTLQSYINPIDNPTVNQKNNPLNSEKSVNKVVQKLLSIGYKST